MDTSFEPALEPAVTSIPPVQGIKFWPRTGAYLIDALVMYGLDFLSGYLLGFVLGIFFLLIATMMGKEFYFVDYDDRCLTYIIGFIRTFIYFAVFEWIFGRTLGKVFLRMRVIRSDGTACNLKQASIRSVYRFIDGLIFGIVAYSSMKPPSYQRLGDKRADTMVVSSKDTMIKDHPAWWKFFLALMLYLVFEGFIVFFLLLARMRFVG